MWCGRTRVLGVEDAGVRPHSARAVTTGSPEYHTPYRMWPNSHRFRRILTTV
ncbi:hypothetical protein MINT15_25480 [Saccharomonospora viridis]|uniref:Uncharacterized protein n=1 Tax=Saccharomonospora viridis TaxID=1852 RepID=A0A837D7Q7_9PSEU|nr:hypothetical protein MINT15_25480 [Saccharomonospora viridis]